jgi:hypothetical protein
LTEQRRLSPFGIVLTGVAGVVAFAALGAAFPSSAPMRAIALAGVMASFLAIVFGMLARFDRTAHAARLRAGLMALIGAGAAIALIARFAGAQSAARLGLRVAFFGVLLAILRTDFLLLALGVGPRTANVMAACAAIALVLDEVAVNYPNPAIRTAILLAQAGAVATVFLGFCRTAFVALRRASGRDKTTHSS